MFSRLVRNTAAKRSFAVRNMGGGHHAAPQGGLDGAVRKYLKEDHHVINPS